MNIPSSKNKIPVPTLIRALTPPKADGGWIDWHCKALNHKLCRVRFEGKRCACICRSQPKLAQNQLRAMAILYERGVTIVRLAKFLEISRQSVRNRLVEQGVKIRPGGYRSRPLPFDLTSTRK